MSEDWVGPVAEGELTIVTRADRAVDELEDAGPISHITAWSVVCALQKYVASYSDFQKMSSKAMNQKLVAKSDRR